MNAAKLLNLAPMLIMVAFLAYAGYSIHASAGDPAEGQSGLAKELDAAAQDILAAGNAIEGSLAGALRDPFQVVFKPVPITPIVQDDASSDSDLLAQIVQGLKLDATFLQGRDQLAIINGRIYSKGQQLLINVDPAKSSATLFVVNILPSKVTLRGGEKIYVLGYPDQLGSRLKSARSAGAGEAQEAELDPGGQLDLLRRLLKSPLGALGRSMTGSPAGSAPRSGRSRGSRTTNP